MQRKCSAIFELMDRGFFSVGKESCRLEKILYFVFRGLEYVRRTEYK